MQLKQTFTWVTIFTLAVAGLHVYAAGRRPIVRPVAAPATPRISFQSLYNDSNNALMKRDLDTAMSCYDSEYVQVIPKIEEPVDLGEVRFRLSSLLSLAKSVSSVTSVVNANVNKGVGSVMVKSTLSMFLINPANRKRGQFIDRIVSKDTWKLYDNEWRLTKSVIISEATTLNGKPVHDKANPFTTPKQDDDSGFSSQPASPGFGPPMGGGE